MLRKVALSTFLLAFAIYIFLPTPDEVFIYPVATVFLCYTLHLSVISAVLLVTLFYYGSGVVALLGALMIGGKPIYNSFQERFRKRRAQPLLKRSAL
jgi:multidrug efflux pump subunit AcrB